MFCKKCGAQLSDNDGICSECGFEIKSTTSKIKQSEDIEQENEKVEKKPKKKKKALKVIIPIVSVLLVVSIVVGVIFYSYLNSPIVKLSNAFDETLFNSSEINLTLTLDEAFLNLYKQADATITFGEGINGSRVEVKAKNEKSYLSFLNDETEMIIENGIVYVGGRETLVISEFIAEAKNGDDEEKKLLASFLEALDKAINGKLDKETMNVFIQNELMPYLEGNADSEAPDMETVEKALTEILKKSIKEEAVTVKESKMDNGSRMDFDVDVNAVIDCMFELSNEDEDVDALVQYITKCMAKGSDGRITDKASLHKYLNESELLKDYEGFEFGITIKSGRITEIIVPGAFTFEIASKK